MAKEYVRGTLIGVRDGMEGPTVVIGTMQGEQKMPLKCEVSIDFAMSRMNTSVVCEVEEGNVVKVS